MSRPRRYESNAARQRAYRQRRANVTRNVTPQVVSVPDSVFLDLGLPFGRIGMPGTEPFCSVCGSPATRFDVSLYAWRCPQHYAD